MKQCCKYCNNIFTQGKIIKHEDVCYLNIKNIRYCKECNSILKNDEKLFCSRSCSAKYNNKNRGPRSLETKHKIGNTLLKNNNGINYVEKELNDYLPKYCKICNKLLIDGKDHCISCNGKINIKSLIQKSRLSLIGYEKPLSEELIKIYGPLRKEIINDIAFDFCNHEFIIEFSFDKWHGVSSMVKRFSNIKNDTREKIAYVPEKYLGQKRRNRLIDLGIKILYSEDYIEFHPNNI